MAYARQHIFNINHNQRRRALIRTRVSPLELYDDTELQSRFRFDRQGILYILDEIQSITDLLEPISGRKCNLSPVIQLCTALQYYASGAFQLVTGDTVNISKSSVSKCVDRITDSLCLLVPDHIKYPEGQRATDIKSSFYEDFNIPNVTGLIDCTHVETMKPPMDQDTFINRKGRCTVNCQVVCDNMYIITNAVARWPGSTHDSKILSNSDLYDEFENGNREGLMLGDSGYPNKDWLLTPFLNPRSQAEENYNRAHKACRAQIERTIGILKIRFACLANKMRFKPGKCCRVFLACCVLHNMAMKRRMAEVGGDYPPYEDTFVHDQQDARNYTVRDRIVRQYFTT